MDNPDPRGAVSNLVSVLRRITRIVQLIPFAYLVLFATYMLLDMVTSDATMGWLDSLINITPSTTACLLFFSRLLKLCRWHKIACIIPVTSDIETFIDSNILQFTQCEVFAIDLVMLVLSVLFLLLAHKHFFSRGC